MIKNVRMRRTLALSLIVLGGVPLLLAPEDIWIGAVLVGLGIALEVVGIALGHRRA